MYPSVRRPPLAVGTPRSSALLGAPVAAAWAAGPCVTATTGSASGADVGQLCGTDNAPALPAWPTSADTGPPPCPNRLGCANCGVGYGAPPPAGGAPGPLISCCPH